MADWKVSAEQIEIFKHPDPDVINLLVARVGMFPLVINKNNGYNSGDIVVFAPKRTILPEDLRSHYVNDMTGESYLKGGTTVKSNRIRGVLSEGVTIPVDYLAERLKSNDISGEYPEFVGKQVEDIIGQDVSALLGMSEQQIDMKVVFGGNMQAVRATSYSRHDVEGIHAFPDEFKPGESVACTVKMHGSQINIIRHEDGFVELSSKGVLGNGAMLTRAEGNIYWTAWDNSGIEAVLSEHYSGRFVQVMGEVVPVQKGFSYGYTKPDIVLFRLEIDGRRYSTWEVMNLDELAPLRKFWVKVVYEGPFDMDIVKRVSKGMEPVSGKNLHVTEGVVVEPKLPRNSDKKHFPLYIKVINPKYKGEDDDDAMS